MFIIKENYLLEHLSFKFYFSRFHFDVPLL